MWRWIPTSEVRKNSTPSSAWTLFNSLNCFHNLFKGAKESWKKRSSDECYDKGAHNIIAQCNHSFTVKTRNGERTIPCTAPIKHSDRSTESKLRFTHFCSWGTTNGGQKRIHFNNSTVPHLDSATPVGSTVKPHCDALVNNPTHTCITWKLIDPQKKPSRFNLEKAKQLIDNMASSAPKNLLELFPAE